MSFIKLTMIENEVEREGEDDTVTVNSQVATCYVEAAAIRSIHARKVDPNGVRREGTRIAFTNGSQFSVSEAPAKVAELLGFIEPNAVN
jgi:hypothetical protein